MIVQNPEDRIAAKQALNTQSTETTADGQSRSDAPKKSVVQAKNNSTLLRSEFRDVPVAQSEHQAKPKTDRDEQFQAFLRKIKSGVEKIGPSLKAAARKLNSPFAFVARNLRAVFSEDTTAAIGFGTTLVGLFGGVVAGVVVGSLLGGPPVGLALGFAGGFTGIVPGVNILKEAI